MNRSPNTRRRRADAERSIASIVGAAVECFSRQPDVSMGEVATAAGVGRVTLYAHFPSREALLEAATDHALTQASAALDAAGIEDVPAPEALRRMIRSGWPAVDRMWGLHAAGGPHSSPRQWERYGQFHARIERLVARGQAEGSFRSDLSVEWLAAALHGLVHAAGQEVRAGRLDPATAPAVLETTLLALLAGPTSRSH